jgi:hypothetical protein
MGHAAVALLASQVAGNPVPTDEMVFEPELVVRGSTGPVGSRDSANRRPRLKGPVLAKGL